MTKVILYFFVWGAVFFIFFFVYFYIMRELKKHKNIVSASFQIILFLVTSVVILGPVISAKKYGFYVHEMDGERFLVFCSLYALAIFPSIIFWVRKLNIRR